MTNQQPPTPSEEGVKELVEAAERLYPNEWQEDERQAFIAGGQQVITAQAEEIEQVMRERDDWSVKCVAQAEENTRLREERDDARSTLEAWFDLAKQNEEAIAPILTAGIAGYLRTAGNGGMPKAKRDIAKAVLDDYVRLYAARDLVPVLRGIQDARAQAAEANSAAQAERIRAVENALRPFLVIADSEGWGDRPGDHPMRAAARHHARAYFTAQQKGDVG